MYFCQNYVEKVISYRRKGPVPQTQTEERKVKWVMNEFCRRDSGHEKTEERKEGGVEKNSGRTLKPRGRNLRDLEKTPTF